MNYLSFVVGLSIGFIATVILLNLSAHYEIDKNPNITLSQYWDGEGK